MDKQSTATVPAIMVDKPADPALADSHTDLRVITYLEPRPTDGMFGVDIVATTQTAKCPSTLTETTTTTWHPVDARDGIRWTPERASLFLAVLGYRVLKGWTRMETDNGITAFGACIVPVND